MAAYCKSLFYRYLTSMASWAILPGLGRGRMGRKQKMAPGGVGRRVAEVAAAIPASEHCEVQTDKYDGRKFITMQVAGNGETAYRKVGLRIDTAVRRSEGLSGSRACSMCSRISRSVICPLSSSASGAPCRRHRRPRIRGDRGQAGRIVAMVLMSTALLTGVCGGSCRRVSGSRVCGRAAEIRSRNFR